MGSMFIVTVPVREHEVTLRKKEMHLSSAHQLDTVLKSQSSEKPRQSFISDAGSLESSGSFVSPRGSVGSEELLQGVSHGKAAQVRVGSDEMVVVNVDDDGMIEKKAKTGETSAIKSIIENRFLEKHLEDCLKKFEIMSATWGQSIDGMYSQVAFTKGAEKSEAIINHLLTCGIGQKYNSSLCVCSAAVYHENDKQGDQNDDNAADNEPGKGSSSDSKAAKTTKWNDFVASIKSRLTVAQVVQGVKANATMTFDFIVLILVAGMIAALGLVDDSSVNVVASMLISPLMGPIMATTFGAVIRDYQLIKTGLLSELVGLLLCLMVGFIFGTCLEMERGPWKDVDVWPTDQMRGRGNYMSLAIGCLVAVPSGCGVALSILAGNAGSLVGVAISASLLPPAVNCGILWGMSAVIAIKEKMAGRSPLIPCKEFLGGYPFNDEKHNKTYYFTQGYYLKYQEKMYCNNAVKEFAYMGIISFALTWLNIVLIFLVGVIILKVKEVAPHTTRKSLNRFWKEDLKIAREFNQSGGTIGGLVNEINLTGDKEGLLRRLNDDKTFNAVNRKALLGPTSIIDDIKNKQQTIDDEILDGKAAKPVKSNKSMGTNTAGGGSGSWLGWLGIGPKPPPPQPVEAEPHVDPVISSTGKTRPPHNTNPNPPRSLNKPK